MAENNPLGKLQALQGSKEAEVSIKEQSERKRQVSGTRRVKWRILSANSEAYPSILTEPSNVKIITLIIKFNDDPTTVQTISNKKKAVTSLCHAIHKVFNVIICSIQANKDKNLVAVECTASYLGVFQNIFDITELQGHQVTCYVYGTHFEGIVRGVHGLTEEQIQSDLEKDGHTIHMVKKYMKKSNLEICDTGTAQITILRDTGTAQITFLHPLPHEVRIQGKVHPVILYEPCPIRCTNCQKFNHVKSNCTGDIKCCKCSGAHHFSECQETTLKCPNCHSNHDAASKLCPFYMQAVKLMKAVQQTGRSPSHHSFAEYVVSAPRLTLRRKISKHLRKLKECHSHSEVSEEQCDDYLAVFDNRLNRQLNEENILPYMRRNKKNKKIRHKPRKGKASVQQHKTNKYGKIRPWPTRRPRKWYY